MTNIGTNEATDTQATGAPDGERPVADTTIRDDNDAESGRGETIAGGVLVGLTVLAALYFRWRPGVTFLDNWGFSLIHPALSNTMWKLLSYLRSTSLLVGGSILAAVIVAGRDRWRALACLVTPTVAVLLTEWVLKPVIERRYAQVLSFPSGTTTLVSAVAMAFIIAVPSRIRPAVAAIGAFLVALECMAVVALQWHFPTDAVGGAIFGAGMVLLIDGVLHIEVGIARRRRATVLVGDAVPVPPQT
jgi:membrane-associated phospholipid phosphatase